MPHPAIVCIRRGFRKQIDLHAIINDFIIPYSKDSEYYNIYSQLNIYGLAGKFSQTAILAYPDRTKFFHKNIKNKKVLGRPKRNRRFEQNLVPLVINV